jgi:predicted anti-sigma-YlaC factor YlaD
MSRCEHREVEVSAFLDGELGRASSLGVVDHLLECPSCREFFHQARSLETPVTGVLGDGGESEMLAALWPEVEGAGARSAASGRRRLLRWSLAAAAVVVVGIGLALGFGRTALLGHNEGDIVRVRLTSNPGQLNEERFVTMTTQLLQADPRYRREMLAILRAVDRLDGAGEGQADVDIRMGRSESRRAVAEAAGAPAAQRVYY